MIAVQCENVKCLDELDEIAAVDGVDVIFIGPFDLSQSMGIPGQVYDEKIEHVMELVLAATKSMGNTQASIPAPSRWQRSTATWDSSILL